MSPSESEPWSAKLREAGLQITAQRLAVQRAIARHAHASSDEILTVVREDLGTISRQAVYDTLNTLTAHGLIRRIEPAQSPALYEGRMDNHHHLICRACGRLHDVDCAKGRAPCMDPLETHGFTIEEAEVIYWGLCPDCQTQSP